MTKIEKLIKKLPTGYAEDVAGYDEADITSAIVECETNIRTTENERENDTKLSGAKEIVKDLSGPYRDAVSAQRAKIAYLLHTLEERGK